INSITRVSGPFCVEATIPTPVDYETPAEAGATTEGHGSFVDRMLEVLRKSPVLQLGGNRKVTLRNVRPPAKTLSLSAEAVVANGNGGKQPSLRVDVSTPAASAQHDRAKNSDTPLQKGEGPGERSVA